MSIRPFLFALAATLIGCAEQVRLPDRVEIPVSVPCLERVPERPLLASDQEILKQNDYAAVLSLWLDRRLRQDYEALLEAGVKIWLSKAPTILHSKHLSIDDDVAVIGSSNMDMRSFSLNLEISLLVRGKEFVDEMRAVEQRYRSVSRQLSMEEWRKQPLRSTVLDGLARLTSALQ